MPDERTSTSQVVGRNLTRRLDELDMSQRQLARRLGIDGSTVSQYCRGAINMSVTTLKQISDILGLKPCDLLHDDEPVAA